MGGTLRVGVWGENEKMDGFWMKNDGGRGMGGLGKLGKWRKLGKITRRISFKTKNTQQKQRNKRIAVANQ
jgi:hypothetical protein